MSLVQSAIMNRVDPWAYLSEVLACMHSHPSARIGELCRIAGNLPSWRAPLTARISEAGRLDAHCANAPKLRDGHFRARRCAARMSGPPGTT
ncbi:TPA: transposase domain-containing protein [Pseudomonas aeruginosa]|nr:transposase domain-containing protein [Pseudomonas aeruginosa]